MDDARISEEYDDAVVTTRIAKLQHKYFCSYAGIFSCLMEEAQGSGQHIYRLLHDACMLSYSRDKGVAFVPFFRRVGDNVELGFAEDEYNALASVVEKISDYKLKARVADLLWSIKRDSGEKNEYKYAKLALESYCQIAITEIGWIGDNQNVDWRRGLILALSLGKSVDDLYARMTNKVQDAWETANQTGDPENLLRWAIPSMLSEDCLNSVIDAEMIAKGLENLVVECVKAKKGEFSISAHARGAAKWYRIAGDEQSMERMEIEVANSDYREAERESKKKDAQWFRAAHFYGATVQTLQKLPVQVRLAYNVDSLLKSALIAYEKSTTLGQGQMKATQTESVDVFKAVKNAQNAIKGRDKYSAIETFIRLYHLTEKDAHNLAETFLSSSLVSALFGKSVVAHGCITASAPAYGFTRDDASKQRLWVETVQKGAYLIQVACNVALYPAFDAIRKEHTLTKSDFQKIVAESPLIPDGHMNVYAEALFVGYNGYFTAATYMLAPEIENVVRCQLKKAGCITATVDSATKLLNENGLSTLLKNHEEIISRIFGDDLLFELKVVFSDHAGPNVRNEVAHGLKNDTTLNGIIDFYVWWFALRLVFMRPKLQKLNGNAKASY